MEDIVLVGLKFLLSFAGGSTFGKILSILVMLMGAGAYFYIKHLIRKFKEDLAKKETEHQKQEDQKKLAEQGKSVGNEAQEGEDKSKDFFGE